MAVVTMRQLLEAGVHFGHQTRRWNPKMRRYILGERNGIYLIDLRKTLDGIDSAYALRPGPGRRRRHHPVRRDQEADPGPGGRVRRGLRDALCQPALARRHADQLLHRVGAGEAHAGAPGHAGGRRLRRHAQERGAPHTSASSRSCRRNLGGIAGLDRLPDAIFVIDTKKEHIAVTEANKLGLPVVAVVDTNCDPDVIDYVIPGNDDAIRSGTLMCRVIADAVVEGRFIAEHRRQMAPAALGRRRRDPHRRRLARCLGAPARPRAGRGGLSVPGYTAKDVPRCAR